MKLVLKALLLVLLPIWLPLMIIYFVITALTGRDKPAEEPWHRHTL